MKIRKISMSDRVIQKKYRVSINYEVSTWREEFDCDGHTAHIIYSTDRKQQRPQFGVSKQEYLVSGGNLINGYSGRVNG